MVVEPETSPDDILEQMEQIINETSPSQKDGTPPGEKTNLPAHKHKDASQRRAENHRTSDTGDLYLFDAGASLPIGNV